MPCACVMAGLHLDFPLIVPVGLHLRRNTPFIVPLGDSLQSDTMNSEIPQPTYSPKYVAMSWLNLLYKSFLENINICPMPQQTGKIKSELILLPEGFGTDIRGHSLMQGSLLHLLVPTSILPCPLVTKAMRMKRGEPMTKESEMWNMDCSLPSSFPLLEI